MDYRCKHICALLNQLFLENMKERGNELKQLE